MSVFKTAGTWFVYATNFQIIGLSETWLQNSITNHEILPKAYSIYSKDRGSRSRSVLLAISNQLVDIYALTRQYRSSDCLYPAL